MITYIIIATIAIILTSSCFLFLTRARYNSTYYENSKQVKFKSQINKEGEKNGTEYLFRPDGKKNKISHWNNGTREGEFTVYWPNGRKYIVGNYKAGKLSGKYTVFSDSGKVEFETTY